LLLKYSREGDYDVMGYYVHAECQDCDGVMTDERKGKCQIPEATRSRMRSLKTLGFKCSGFDYKNYSNLAVSYIYKRKPIK